MNWWQANFNKRINHDVLTRLIKKQENWGRSSVGRAPALQAGGQEFESLRLHCEYDSQANIQITQQRLHDSNI